MNLPERYDIKELDNRDSDTTWIWLDGTDTPSYVEVDPIELFTNMLENLDPEDRDRVWEDVHFQVFGG